MKVYKIETGTPTVGRHKEFATLDCKRTDSKYFDELGRGELAVSWKPKELHVFNPAAPRPDIFSFSLDHVLSPRAFEIVGELLAKSGELLPVTIKGQEGTHYFYNCTTVADVLDEKRAIYEFCKPIGRTVIQIPAFHSNGLIDASVFKFPQYGLVSIYCVEHTASHRDGELKALVEHHQLAGWKFHLLWSDEAGPAAPRLNYTEDQPFEHRSHDGKRLVYDGSKWVVKPPSKAIPPKLEPKLGEPPAKQVRASRSTQTKAAPKPPKRARKGIRILQLQAVIPSTKGKLQPAPCLSCKPADHAFLAPERFRGHPFPEDWRTVELNFGKSKPWKADFYFFGPGALVCSKRAIDTYALAPLEDEGEFLPVRIKGMPGKYFLFNSSNCTNYLNEKLTVWKKSRAGIEPRQISKHVFRAQKIGGDCLFKLIEEGGVNLYCLDRTGEYYDDEFKVLVETEKLTGVTFKTVWTGGR